MDTSPKAQYENANRYDKISGFVLCFVAKVALNSWIATIWLRQISQWRLILSFGILLATNKRH